MKINIPQRIKVQIAMGCLAAISWLGISSIAYPTAINNAEILGKPMDETVLNDENNGKSIETRVGAILTVRLKESPTTGYVWINKTVGDALLMQESDFSPTSPGIIAGAPGLRTLRFVVSKPGNATLLLKRMRDWEGDASAVEVFSVSIHATQP